MQNEQPAFPPFQSLNSDPPAAGGGEPEKKKRGRPKAAKPAKEAPKRRRRVAKPEKQPRGSSLDVATAITAFAGLKGPECELVGELVIKLQGAPKRSRAKIIAALGKVFA